MRLQINILIFYWKNVSLQLFRGIPKAMGNFLTPVSAESSSGTAPKM